MPSTPNKNAKLILFDSMALAYRSYFAFIRNPLVNSKGVNTSGVYGFTNTLMRIIRDEKPDFVACVFDMKAPTFRHLAYPEYKATREKMPDEMREQMPVIREVVEAFRIPILEKEGFEADDVIATLARKAEAQDIDTYIISGDKDLMQLLSDKIFMMSLSRTGGELEVVGPEGAKTRLGVPPEQVISLLGLMGDSSDNVPGVPGIGPKTAAALLEQFGSLEAVLDHAEEIPQKGVREKILANKEKALLSRDLVTLKTDVDLDLDIHHLKLPEPDQEHLIALFKELEFGRLLNELPNVVPEKPQERCCDYQTVRGLDALEILVNKLRKVPMFAFDIETTSISPMEAELVGLSFSFEKGKAFYVPVKSEETICSGDLFDADHSQYRQTVLNQLRPVLEDPTIRKCGQNIKYDMLVLSQYDVHVQGVDFDTMIAAYLINPSARQFNLDALSLEYLNIKKIPTSDIIGTGQKQITMDFAPIEKVSEYACEDADAAFQLRQVLEPQLKNAELTPLFRDVEMPLVPVLMEMEKSGVALDVDLLSGMSGDMEKQLGEIEKEIYDIAGETFNIRSTQQLGVILFDKLKIHELVGWKRPKRTKTGYATDVSVLESLAIHPLPQKLLDYRQLQKLKSTYVDALPKLINPKTNRVHASFNQTVAATGRLSSSNPNLQNIPIRTDLGREIRKAFIPGFKNGCIFSADYSQIELRILAHISGDETLIQSFKNEEDVHRRTASEVFGVSPEEVTADLRRKAKTINFGIIYGMGPYGLAQRLGIPVSEADQFINAYFARYPKVNAYMANTIALAYEQGFVTTLLNRRRYLPELKSDNKNIRDFGERTAINMPIQGTAADLIKIAMIHIHKRLTEEKWQSKMVLQIHDELVFDTPNDEADALAEMVIKEMESAIALTVPVKVDAGMGENWYEAH